MPCKPRMTGCSVRCLHRQLVENYRDARWAWEAQAEAETHGYATELADYARDNPGPTFKAWLEGSAANPPV